MAALRSAGLTWSEIVGAMDPELSVQLRAVVEILRAVQAFHATSARGSSVQRSSGMNPQHFVITRDGRAVLPSQLQGTEPDVRSSFIAPEARAGGELSEQADVYSVGAMLYEVLTGHRFESEEVARDESHQVHALVLSSGVDGCSWELELLGVATRATKLSLSKRWASARTFADEITRVAAGRVASRAELGQVVVEAIGRLQRGSVPAPPRSSPARCRDTLIGWSPSADEAPADSSVREVAADAAEVAAASERPGAAAIADTQPALQPPAESPAEEPTEELEVESRAVSSESEPVALSVSQPPQVPEETSEAPPYAPPFAGDTPQPFPASNRRGGKLLFVAVAVSSAILLGYWAGRSEGASADQVAGPVAETPIQFKPAHPDGAESIGEQGRDREEAPVVGLASASAAELAEDAEIPPPPCSTCSGALPRAASAAPPQRRRPRVRRRIAPRPVPAAPRPTRQPTEEEADYGI